jgi:hypothetical protein
MAENPTDAGNPMDQVKRNYKSFVDKLPSLLALHRGEFALMRDGEIVDFFDTVRDAYVAGQKLFGVDGFSIQEVVDRPVDLGYFSYALPQ